MVERELIQRINMRRVYTIIALSLFLFSCGQTENNNSFGYELNDSLPFEDKLLVLEKKSIEKGPIYDTLFDGFSPNMTDAEIISNLKKLEKSGKANDISGSYYTELFIGSKSLFLKYQYDNLDAGLFALTSEEDMYSINDYKSLLSIFDEKYPLNIIDTSKFIFNDLKVYMDGNKEIGVGYNDNKILIYYQDILKKWANAKRSKEFIEKSKDSTKSRI